MTAPVRLVTGVVAPPKSLLATLSRVDAAATPTWMNAPVQPVRALLTATPVIEEAPVSAPVVVEAVVDPALVAKAVEEAVALASAVAEKAAIAAGQAKVDAIIERYADGIVHLAEAAERRSAGDAESAVSLALIVAQEILGREVAIDRTFLVTMVGEALATAGGEQAVRLRIGATDRAYLEATRPDVLGAPGVEVVVDDSLGIGGCVVESDHRVVDARLETRLAAVGAALRQALAQEGTS